MWTGGRVGKKFLKGAGSTNSVIIPLLLYHQKLNFILDKNTKMPTVINFQDSNSIYNTFLSELRDKNIQSDAMRFRRNLERLGEISALEISRHLHYRSKILLLLWGQLQ